MIVDFFATWCGPCVKIAPYFVKLAEIHHGQGIFIKVDVDEGSDISKWAGVSAMPTFKVYKNNTEVEKMVGGDPNGLDRLFTKYCPVQ